MVMKKLGAILVVLMGVGSLTSAGASGTKGSNVTCMLVFGDSTVDPGNNNHIRGASKANFPPYGMDYNGGQPTGRFCDGRLTTDFIADGLGISKTIPAFLDPALELEQLQHGVSFASASSGYDELTAKHSSVFSFPNQIKYLMHYKIHLKSSVGSMKANQIISNSVAIISAGTNDFIQNYFFYPDRPKQFTVGQYQDYLINLMTNYTKEIHGLGLRRFVVAGVPPMGCLPIVKTLSGSTGCVDGLNNVSASFNSKLVAQLGTLKKMLGVKIYYLDIFRIMSEVARKPAKYGFTETSKGCCGSGLIEMGDTCKGQTTCKDPSKYMYWDAVHPSQQMYKTIADEAMEGVVKEIVG